MSFGEIFQTILYDPLLNALMVLYRTTGDLGLAIIFLTLIIKLALFPTSHAQLKGQAALQETQPKLRALKEQYKNDREGYQRAVIQFYKENKVNPFASCLPLLIQLPILIALYQVFIAGLKVEPSTGLLLEAQRQHLYGGLEAYFALHPIELMSFNLFDLSKTRNVILALLAGGVTYWQSRMLSTRRPPVAAGAGGKDEERLASMNKSMMMIAPIMTIFFAYTFPAGLGLYWFVSTLFQVGQQVLFFRKQPT